MQGIETLKVGSTYTVNSYDFEQFIPTNAHRHMMSIVYFINSLPQYVFRRAYIAIANKRNYWHHMSVCICWYKLFNETKMHGECNVKFSYDFVLAS
jgi:sarcosine oxidase delta subunit